MTTSEAARLLSEGLGRPVSPRNVQDAARRGRIRADFVNSRYRVPLEEVHRILAEGSSGKEQT